MKSLNGAELAGFIKERQRHTVSAISALRKRRPVLAIVQTIDDPVIDTYVRLKIRYGGDIGIDVRLHKIAQLDAVDTVAVLNNDATVDGIIIQLPLADVAQTQQLVDAVLPTKDVDALGNGAVFDPATAVAINWLTAGYNIELRNKAIVIVGNGRLVGAPLAKMWSGSGYDVTVLDKSTEDLRPFLQDADVIVTATGVPNLITGDMIRPDTVVIDAAVTSEDGKLIGDLSPELRTRQDIYMTPEKGGVGPLTVAALFDNVIRAAQSEAARS